MTSTLRKFRTIYELIAHIKSETSVYYRGPMDTEPRPVEIRQYTINVGDSNKCEVTLGSYTVNLADHLDRFRIREVR